MWLGDHAGKPVADLGEGFRGSEPPLNSGNNYADWLEIARLVG